MVRGLQAARAYGGADGDQPRPDVDLPSQTRGLRHFRDARLLNSRHNGRMNAVSSPFQLVPLLEIMRDYHRLPRNQERFEAYISMVTGGAQQTADLALAPLVAMNPMGKDHVLERLEAWIELDAERCVAALLEEAAPRLEVVLPPLKIGLVIVDDLKGGWTNRYFNDAGFRFKLTGIKKTGWVSVPLWSSEAPNLERLRLQTLETVARVAYFWQRGEPQTLREMLRQEGQVAAFAGREVTLDADDLLYTRAILELLLDSMHQPTVMAALYGDEAAISLGYPPLGVSPRAGFELALWEAQR
jgi:hypothetical protein